MTPDQGGYIILFSFVPSSNFLISFLDPCRAFCADTAPFKGSQPLEPHTEKQAHRKVCRADRLIRRSQAGGSIPSVPHVDVSSGNPNQNKKSHNRIFNKILFLNYAVMQPFYKRSTNHDCRLLNLSGCHVI